MKKYIFKLINKLTLSRNIILFCIINSIILSITFYALYWNNNIKKYSDIEIFNSYVSKNLNKTNSSINKLNDYIKKIISNDNQNMKFKSSTNFLLDGFYVKTLDLTIKKLNSKFIQTNNGFKEISVIQYSNNDMETSLMFSRLYTLILLNDLPNIHLIHEDINNNIIVISELILDV